MSNTTLAFMAIVLSAGLDIISNILLDRSKGFTKPVIGICALALVGMAFYSMAQAMRLGMDLSIAYPLWGALGILGTSFCAWFLLGQKLHKSAWLGIVLLISGVVLLQTA